MKLRIWFLAGALAVPACSKANDNVSVLHEHVVAIAKYNKPRLDLFQKRLVAITQRGHGLPQVPDAADAQRAFTEATGKLRELVEYDNALEKNADGLAKDGNAQALFKLVDEAEKKNDEEGTIINDDLTALSGWLSRIEAQRAAPAPAPEPPPAPSTEGEPAAPPANTETPKAETPKAETPKAETPKAETPKAEAGKKAGAKGEPAKHETPKKESPKKEPAKP
jgi:hypothetical protein